MADGTLVTIGELARRTGLTAKTVRFWSDQGLVPPADRTTAGYRRYGLLAACSQRDPALTKLIAVRGGMPAARIDRFVLTNSLPGGSSGWTIYPASGTTRFQSLVLGDHLVMITPSGTRALR